MGSTQHILSSAVTLVGDREPFRHKRDSGKFVQRGGWGRSSSRRTTAYGSGTEGPSLARSTQQQQQQEEEEQQVRVALFHTRAIVLSCETYLSRNVFVTFLSLSLSFCTGSVPSIADTDVSGARVRARVSATCVLARPRGFPKEEARLELGAGQHQHGQQGLLWQIALFCPWVVCELSSTARSSPAERLRSSSSRGRRTEYGSWNLDPRNFNGSLENDVSHLCSRLKVTMSSTEGHIQGGVNTDQSCIFYLYFYFYFYSTSPPLDTSDVLQAHLDRLLRVVHQSL